MSLFSFNPSTDIAEYNDISDNYTSAETSADFIQFGEFTESEESRFTSDKTEWNHRYKTWSDIFSAAVNVNTIEKILAQN